MTQHIIRADIVGNNNATACNITAKGRTPILTLCHACSEPGTTQPHRCTATEVTCWRSPLPPSATVRS